MKRLILIMLVAMVPFLSIAQKKGNKDKVETTTSNASYEFMVINGHDITHMATRNPAAISDDRNETEQKIKISFDFGGVRAPEELSEMQYRSMAHAVNVAAKYGWEFINATIVNAGEMKMHYYYMKRKK
jgi:hypothetical protein